MHNKEEWNAGFTNMTVREEDVHDCDPVRQGEGDAARQHHMSPHDLTSSTTVSEF